ncbi:serine/threonine protein phosphatase [Staphylococcus phage CF7]|nr:serine/threonine protein phosphatase [Staphylococcus phage CF7]
MAIYVVPDIHGEYEKLITIMNKIDKERQPGDVIVFLGDYIDRGNKSREVVNYVFERVSNDDDVIPLLGNHDDAFWHSIENIERLDIYNVEWFARYCIETLESYGINTTPLKSFELNQNEFYREYFDKFITEIKAFKESEDYRKFNILMHNCAIIYKQDKYEFTHSGGISWKQAKNQTKDQLLWSRDFQPRNDGFIHVCGHTPTISGEVEEHNDMLLCDVGAVFRDIDLPLIKLEDF